MTNIWTISSQKLNSVNKHNLFSHLISFGWRVRFLCVCVVRWARICIVDDGLHRHHDDDDVFGFSDSLYTSLCAEIQRIFNGWAKAILSFFFFLRKISTSCWGTLIIHRQMNINNWIPSCCIHSSTVFVRHNFAREWEWDKNVKYSNCAFVFC